MSKHAIRQDELQKSGNPYILQKNIERSVIFTFMKKLVFMAIIALLTLSACSGGSKNEHISLTDADAQTDAASNQDNSKQEDGNSSGIEVDKGS
ncbi:hypothetical protein [Thermobacillus sp.]|jgi:hypothetical protein|uniref:hypothetical protein n=1 Tax=Thermobacillus sp. TaxID=2108467 RepID=UPI00258015C8|nr:hypothetical protein [Thermobacillus sp.]